MTLDYSIARRRMVDEQLAAAGIEDQRVLAAMRYVPRHAFVPRLLRHRAYRPCALPIGYEQTISQPFIVGLMTALLELDGSETVLEIGTGSGYQAAVLSGLTSSVTSVERIVPLAERAARVLKEHEYSNVSVYAADGCGGHTEQAPYARVLVTACAEAFPEELMDQVVDGGFLLAPVDTGDGRQVLFRYHRRNGRIVTERSVGCSFVPLVPGLAPGKANGGEA